MTLRAHVLERGRRLGSIESTPGGLVGRGKHRELLEDLIRERLPGQTDAEFFAALAEKYDNPYFLVEVEEDGAVPTKTARKPGDRPHAPRATPPA